MSFRRGESPSLFINNLLRSRLSGMLLRKKLSGNRHEIFLPAAGGIRNDGLIKKLKNESR